MKVKTLKIALFLGTALASGLALANQGNQDDRGQRRGPPPEAIEACQNSQEGDTVSFESRRGDTITGTCAIINDQLVAVPEGHKERGKRD